MKAPLLICVILMFYWAGMVDAKSAKRFHGPRGGLGCDVGIVGGGISGLYTAYELLKSEKETNVCIFEKEARLGGRILDHNFKQAPHVDVGLGAWRIDKNHKIMLKLTEELGIKHTEWTFTKPTLHESREFRAANTSYIKNGYPALKADPKFGPMSAGDMLSYSLNPKHVANAHRFATVDTYFSHYLTPEGAEYISELYGYKGDYTEFVNPKAYIEFTINSLKLSDKYLRPVGGMSTIIDVLTAKVKELGGKIFKNTKVHTIERSGKHYEISTHRMKVEVEKLVVAVPPLQFSKVSGSVAKKIQHTPQFQSIQSIPAFKGGAIYEKPWWENVKVAGETVKGGQRYISNSNCVGSSMAHRDKGVNGEGIMHTMYSDGACATRWANIMTLKKSVFETEVHRALEWKFGTKIPKPLDTAYKYWEAAWHFQKPGHLYTMVEISDWAKRPFHGENIFVVGEAFHPSRGWCEGAIISTQNALAEGWGMSFNRFKESAESSMERDEEYLLNIISKLVKVKEVVRP